MGVEVRFMARFDPPLPSWRWGSIWNWGYEHNPRGPRGRGGVASHKGSEVACDFFGEPPSGGTKTGTAWPLCRARAAPLGVCVAQKGTLASKAVIGIDPQRIARI
jgi:hypothetical protein